MWILLLAACGAADPEDPEPRYLDEPLDELRTAGEREYTLYVPTTVDLARPVPIVFDFHGATPSFVPAVPSHRIISEGDRDADEHGYVTVFPQGRVIGSDQRWDSNPGSEDLAFFDAMIEALDAELGLDRRRIFARGFSSGGFFAWALACERSSVVAAVAPVAGANGTDGCAAEGQVPLLAFNGTDDPRVGFSRARSSVDDWAEAGGCDVEETTYAVGDATCVRRSDCGGVTELCTIEGGGHAWPGSAGSQTLLTGTGEGPTSVDIDADDHMWAFFEAMAP